MGALRAAELWSLGMIGIGRIFAEYRDGLRTADADVALVHGPAALGYPPLSLPLVDLEYGTGELLALQAITEDEYAQILKSGRNIFFKDRTWSTVLTAAFEDVSRSLDIEKTVEGLELGIKARDAIQVIDFMRQKMGPLEKPPVHIQTTFVEELQRRMSL